MPASELNEISKKMSYILRHAPESVGLKMESDGSVDLDELAKSLSITVDAVRGIVSSDSKSRYVISGKRIWAAQGHSIDVEVPLERVQELTESGLLFHGTQIHNLDSIRVGGIISNSRKWVHLSGNVGTAREVADRRKGVSTVVTIDAAAMLANGVEIFKSSNGVYLVHEVRPRYIVETLARLNTDSVISNNGFYPRGFVKP